MKPKALKVFVYRNLNLPGPLAWFSVRNVSTGRVLMHSPSVCLRNVTFKVFEKGRQRVLSQRRKNVHAGVQGELILDPSQMRPSDNVPRRKVTYNPYQNFSFVDEGGNVITWSPYVWLRDGKVFIP